MTAVARLLCGSTRRITLDDEQFAQVWIALLAVGQLAREVRAPATCFVMSVKGREVGVRFFSTAQEYPMCGHGTLALMTGLVSRGYLDISRGSSDKVTLRTPASSATVTVDHQDDGRIEVMLNLEPAEFEPVSIDEKTLERLFGAGAGDLDGSLPVEYTRSDFSHLVIPMSSLLGVQSLAPDFEQLADYCEQMDVDTVMLDSGGFRSKRFKYRFLTVKRFNP